MGGLVTNMCLQTQGSNILLSLSDALDPDDAGGTLSTATFGINLKSKLLPLLTHHDLIIGGWNYILVNVKKRMPAGKMDAEVYAVHESNCNTFAYDSKNNVNQKEYFDNITYYGCIGNTLTESGGTLAPGNEPLSGII